MIVEQKEGDTKSTITILILLIMEEESEAIHEEIEIVAFSAKVFSRVDGHLKIF